MLSESASANFRHSGWANQRARIMDALTDCQINSTRLYRFGHCGDSAYLVRSLRDPSRVKVAGSCCHDRWCLPCARMRSRTIAANLASITLGRSLRLMTLTLHHRDVPLREEIDRLQTSFAGIRRSKLWTDTIQGGVAIVEVARGSGNNTWHPHLHIIYEGSYFPQPKLKELWRKVTGDSYIVDIRKIESEAMLINYVTKYVSKPWTGDVERSPELMQEIIRAMDARRLCTTFGTWRGLKLTVPPITDDWENLGSLEHWLYLAKQGDAQAIELLSHLGTIVIRECLKMIPDATPEPRPPPKQLHLW